MFLDPTTNFEVKNEIQKPELNKSPGNDGLTAKVIKCVSNAVSKPLSHIYCI
jgi:hypothetical protein